MRENEFPSSQTASLTTSSSRKKTFAFHHLATYKRVKKKKSFQLKQNKQKLPRRMKERGFRFPVCMRAASLSYAKHCRVLLFFFSPSLLPRHFFLHFFQFYCVPRCVDSFVNVLSIVINEPSDKLAN